MSTPQPCNQIADFLDLMAERQPQKQAVVFANQRDAQGRVCYSHLTYQQLSHQVVALAQQLRQQGFTKGMRCALMVPPSIEFFVLTFSLFKLGCVPVFIDPGIGRHHLKTCIKKADPEAFIGIPKAHLARCLLRWKPQAGSFKHLITVGRRFGWGGQTLKSISKNHSLDTEVKRPFAPVSEVDPAAVLFTSGSTGTPKGANYVHGNFMAQIHALSSAFAFKEDEVDLCTFPLFALFAPALGMTALIPTMDFSCPASVNPQYLFEALENFPVTNMFGSPALIKVFAQASRRHNRTWPQLRRVITAGAPVPASTLALLRPCLGTHTKIFTPYGATEALPVAIIEAHEVLEDTAQKTAQGAGICVGQFCNNTSIGIIAITDEIVATSKDWQLLPPGVIGEIIVKGPQVTQSYLGDASATARAKISEVKIKVEKIRVESETPAPESPTRQNNFPPVWHRMGDVGYTDEQGRLWYCGRKSHRVITTKGTMFTIPCEAIFNQHPNVLRSALVGVPCDVEKGFQKPVMWIEPEPSADLASLAHELLDLAKTNPLTATIKVILFRKAFPVDIRHNAKIFRELLQVDATRTPHKFPRFEGAT